MTKEQQALLYLVRLGIGNNTGSGFDFTGVEWRDLVDSSFAQAVPAIAVDGLQHLYESIPSLELAIDRPELETLKYEWFASAFDAELRNSIVSARAKEVYEFFAEAGFRSCVLKGQGLAQLYPVPEHRTSGDIDLWVEGDRDEVLDCIRQKGIRITHVDVKHSDAEFFEDVPVEIHSLPSYTFDPICWRRLRKWAGKQIGI